MSKNPYQVSDEDYGMIVKNQLGNGRDIYEVITGARKNLFRTSSGPSKDHTQLIASNEINMSVNLGKLHPKHFVLFLAEFKKELHKNILKKDLFDLKIPSPLVSSDTNYKAYEKLERGYPFYNVDARSGYWQSLYKLGYISKSMYDRYMPLDDYKPAKRLCASFLGRQVKATYHNREGDNKVITCETGIYEQVYENVRNKLHSYAFGCAEASQGLYLKFITDGIYLLAPQVDSVRRYMDSEQIEYKITRCEKIDNSKFKFGARTKFF